MFWTYSKNTDNILINNKPMKPIAEMNRREMLIEFKRWDLKKYHKAILPDEIIEEIVDNFLTFDSYHNLNKN
jgi:hypothetical protein